MDIRTVRNLDQLHDVTREARAQGKQVVYLGDHQVRVVARNTVSQALVSLVHQDQREAARLDAFATQLRDAEVAGGHIRARSIEERRSALIGKTITPELASRLIGDPVRRHGQTEAWNTRINIDHTGVVRGLPPDLGEFELQQLELGVTRGLDVKNASGERDAARTESESVLDMLGTLRHEKRRTTDAATTAALEESEAELTQLWLSGTMDGPSAARALMNCASRLEPHFRVNGDAETPSPIVNKAAALVNECLADKNIHQRHDNAFGRLFESHLAKSLVDNPALSMRIAATRINSFIRDHIRQVSPSSLERIKTRLGAQADDPQALQTAIDAKVQERVRDLARDLAKDARPWHAEVPEVAAFIADPTPDTLDALLGETSNGWQMIKTYWVAAKYSAGLRGSWMAGANENYQHFVKANRSSQATPLSAAGVNQVPAVAVRAESALRNLISSLQAEMMAKGLSDETALGTRVSMLRSALSDIRDHSGINSREAATKANRDLLLTDFKRALVMVRDVGGEAEDVLNQAINEIEQLPEGADSNDVALEVVTEAGPAGTSVIQDPDAKDLQRNVWGTSLPHQPRPAVPENWAPASSVSARTGFNPAAMTTFESNALSRNQNTVNGISGTTNMLTFLLLHMEREGLLGTGRNAMPHGDALAGNLAFIVMDGGHSIPEAAATYASIMADTRVVHDGVVSGAERLRVEAERAPILARRQAALDSHVTDYSRMHENFGSFDTQMRLDEAVRAGFETARRHFDQLAAERSQT